MVILNKRNIKRYLKNKGYSCNKVRLLEGGMINPIFLIDESFVVKQSVSAGREGGGIEHLDFPRERMVNELFYSKIANMYSPKHVPRLLYFDIENFIIIMEYCNGTLMKDYLQKNRIGRKTIRSILDFLLNMHNNTIGDKLVQLMVDHKNYWDLKYEVEFLEIKTNKEVKNKIKEFVQKFRGRKYCLVHGDFNSKNTLIMKDGTIKTFDFEESAFSDPAHDIGKMIGHLLIFQKMGNVDLVDIRFLLDEYLNRIRLGNKKALKNSIMIHAGCQIMTRLQGITKVDFIPKDIKPILKKISEDMIRGYYDL